MPTWSPTSGNNYQTSANWVGGSPTTTTEAIFDGGVSNANCIVNVAGLVCSNFRVINGYTGTITFNFQLNVYGNYVVDSASATSWTFSGSSTTGLLFRANSTIDIPTSRVDSCIGASILTSGVSITLTLTRDTTINHFTVTQNQPNTTNTITINRTSAGNGDNLYITGNLTHRAGLITIQGTSTINFTTSGTSVLDNLSPIVNNVIFNGNTFTGTLYKSGGTLIRTSGTVSGLSATVINTTITTNGGLWGSIISPAVASSVITTTDDLIINSTYSQFNSLVVNWVQNSGSVVRMRGTSASINSTNLTIIFDGSQNCSVTGGNQISNLNITFNPSPGGQITIGNFSSLGGSSIITYLTSNGGPIPNGTSATLSVTGNATFDTDRGSGNNITFGTLSFGLQTITLSSNLTLSGSISHINTGTITSSGRTIYVGGAFVCSVLTLTSTTVVMNGSGNLQLADLRGNGTLEINTTGRLTFSNSTIAPAFRWISGSVITAGTTVTLNSPSITSGEIVWNNLNLMVNGTITLLSDLYVINFFLTQQGFTTTINGFTIYVLGNLSVQGTTSTATGNSNIVLIGTGRVTNTQTTGNFRNNLEINTKGVITLSGSIRYATGTLRYTSGNIISTGATLVLVSACNVLGFNKIDLETVTITGGTIIAMDGFFSGAPGKLCRVQSTNTTNYIINFLDSFEKTTQFVRMTNCTISATSSPLLITTDGAFTNITTTSANNRVRYYNQIPNGVGKGFQVEPTRILYLAGNTFLIPDPTIT
jgi:hypothetical protein